MNHLPSIAQLRAFEAAVRYGSVMAAAKALHLTQAAVSKQISQLEEQLQLSLFLRSAEGLELTEIGVIYYRQVEQALLLLEQAEKEVKPAGSVNRQRLVLSVDGAFCAAWLAPRLGQFIAAHPHIDLEIAVGKTLADNSGKNLIAADILITYGRPPWPRYRSEKLIDFKEFPVCSPEYAKRISNIEDLGRLTLIHEADHTGWSRWLQHSNARAVDYHRGPIVHDSMSCLTMAVNGVGVAIGDSLTCADWLQQGKLVKPFRQELELAESFYMLMPEVVAVSSAVEDFSDWLRSQLPA